MFASGGFDAAEGPAPGADDIPVWHRTLRGQDDLSTVLGVVSGEMYRSRKGVICDEERVMMRWFSGSDGIIVHTYHAARVALPRKF